jgi:hypothetical protein
MKSIVGDKDRIVVGSVKTSTTVLLLLSGLGTVDLRATDRHEYAPMRKRIRQAVGVHQRDGECRGYGGCLQRERD